jgi:hypothetical protein
MGVGLDPVWKKSPSSSRSSFVDLNFFTWPVLITIQRRRTAMPSAYTYRSCTSTPTAPRRCKTRIPELTRPNIVCLLSRNGVGARVMKNCEPRKAKKKKGRARRECSWWRSEEVGGEWVARTNEPLVLGPELAMARIPAPVNRSSGWISSSLR